MYVTDIEAAKYYGVTPQTIRLWAMTETIKSSNISEDKCRYWLDGSKEDSNVGIASNEIWSRIVVDGIDWNYEISGKGRVRIHTTRRKYRVIAQAEQGKYNAVTLFYNNEPRAFLVHRLVAQAFVHNADPELYIHVDHKNNIGCDNRYENLEWVTHAENIRRAHQKEGRKSTKKEVLRIDSDGNVVEYDSATAARIEFGTHVFACLADGTGTKTAGGYTWKYKYPQPNKVPIGELNLSLFKDIKKHNNFMISRDARVYNKSRQMFLSPRPTGKYLSVVLDGVHYCVHTLVADHFSNDPPNQIVNHEDGNKHNNVIDNLKPMTYSDNTNHALATGLRPSHRSVLQFDKYDRFMEEYASAVAAAKVFDKNLNGTIGISCNDPNFQRMAAGYKWRRKTREVCELYNLDYDSINVSDNTDHTFRQCVRSVPVLEFDLEDNFVDEHECVTMAANKHGLKIVASILSSCYDPEFKKTSAGSKWRHKTEELAKQYNLEWV